MSGDWTRSRLGREIQRDETAARKVLERLVEAGLVEAHGVRKGRTYTLSPKVYKALGQPADYVRQAGFDPIQQEQMVLQLARTQGRIARKTLRPCAGSPRTRRVISFANWPRKASWFWSAEDGEPIIAPPDHVENADSVFLNRALRV